MRRKATYCHHVLRCMSIDGRELEIWSVGLCYVFTDRNGEPYIRGIPDSFSYVAVEAGKAPHAQAAELAERFATTTAPAFYWQDGFWGSVQ